MSLKGEFSFGLVGAEVLVLMVRMHMRYRRAAGSPGTGGSQRIRVLAWTAPGFEMIVE